MICSKYYPSGYIRHEIRFNGSSDAPLFAKTVKVSHTLVRRNGFYCRLDEMDLKFYKRATWFLDEMREGVFPNSTSLAGEFSVSPKTASRVIERLKSDLEVPVQYNSAKRGFYLADPNYKLPFFCDFSTDEIATLGLAIARFSENGEGQYAEVLRELLQRGNVES